MRAHAGWGWDEKWVVPKLLLYDPTAPSGWITAENTPDFFDSAPRLAWEGRAQVGDII